MDTREELEARAEALGLKVPGNIGDEKLAKRIREAEAAADEGGPTVTVICAVPGGRRRAGRRWDGGETRVPEDEFTEEMAKALARDPMFQVVEA
ncbi:hypothetical protein BOO69_09665 [Sulfitobacter alexandrii]|uniref:Uncharacterized protein n=1 Tax=Sulfitobacter alexandrii TaxID=1917485 RepID=A0A1J0WH41_9RHOB|nr:hypothetical protein [Sulfitobacter alexandrii]APE43652.1 hypothetical protein BOO69_09665 [Sulfitobacter alexandrii]